MVRPFVRHESWETSWYWRIGRIEIELFKPAYRSTEGWRVRDPDGCYGLFTPYCAMTWLPRRTS